MDMSSMLPFLLGGMGGGNNKGIDPSMLMNMFGGGASCPPQPPPINVNKYFNPQGGPCPPPPCPPPPCPPNQNDYLMKMLTNMLIAQQQPCPPSPYPSPYPPPPPHAPRAMCFAPIKPWCGTEILLYLGTLCGRL